MTRRAEIPKRVRRQFGPLGRDGQYFGRYMAVTLCGGSPLLNKNKNAVSFTKYHSKNRRGGVVRLTFIQRVESYGLFHEAVENR